nr:HAMP domain-containing sensor histidine kinase [Desulfurispira natronophila]
MTSVDDGKFLEEIERRFLEKNASITEMQGMTRHLLEMNEKARQAEAIKNEFLSLIKNEFNNPISSLLSFSKALAHGKHTHRAGEMTRMAHQEMLRLDFHMQNIFAAAEIESGQLQNDYTEVQLEEVMEQVCRYLRYIIDEKSLDINVKNNLSRPFISDNQKFFTMLLNLVSNACEYSHDQSCIEITATESPDGMIILQVTDQGEGIPTQYHDRIYNRFTQFHSGKNRPHTGLGLGLSVVKGVAESLEGSISSQSEPGKTTFTLLFPAKPSDLEHGSDNMKEFDDEPFDDEDTLEL